MKKVLYVILWFTPIAYIIVVFALIGIIAPTYASKSYYLDEVNFNIAIQRLDSLPIRLNECAKLSKYMKQYQKYSYKNTPWRIDYIRWPLDCNTLVYFECDSFNNVIDIHSFEYKGRYRKVNNGGFFIEQINVFSKFEQTIFKGLKYKSDTSLFKDALKHIKRKFIDLCLWWPLIAMVSFLIYWAIYGNPFASNNSDTNN